MRAIGRSGMDHDHARALILGFAYFPEALPAHCEQLATLAIADRSLAMLRDRLVDAALSGAPLDREGLATILADSGAAEDLERARRAGTLAFSFTRSETEPDKAVRDLEVAIDALTADGDIEVALQAATERLKGGEDEAFEEQQRLHSAREEIKERLASLVGTD
jgi:DNA primase